MNAEDIVAAYQPVADLFRESTFATPHDGWTASLVVAHLTTNNDAIASAALRVVAGEPATYDNREVTSDERLHDFVLAQPDLVGELERSARRLAEARAALDEETGAKEIGVVIADGGTVVVDARWAIADLVEGNATGHLAAHVEQLRALVSASNA